MRNFSKIISKLGWRISVTGKQGEVCGRGVIYPLRYHQQQWGSVNLNEEGRSEAERYLLLCDKNLLKNASYGCVIRDENGNSYRLIWKDDYSCSVGSYAKACMRKMSKEEEYE